MKTPKGYTLDSTQEVSSNTHILKLVNSLYGQKQAGRLRNKFLEKWLLKLGYKPSAVDPCVYYRKVVIFPVYVDDRIFMSPNKSSVDKAIEELREAKYNIEDQSNIAYYLGVKVNRVGKTI